MITFDHNNEHITGAVGTTIDNVREYLTNLKDDNGNPPETNRDVVDIIMKDIERHKPEAVAIMTQGFTSKPFSFVELYGGDKTVALQMLHIAHGTATKAAEALLNHYGNNKELIELLVIGTLMAIMEK